MKEEKNKMVFKKLRERFKKQPLTEDKVRSLEKAAKLQSRAAAAQMRIRKAKSESFKASGFGRAVEGFGKLGGEFGSEFTGGKARRRGGGSNSDFDLFGSGYGPVKKRRKRRKSRGKIIQIRL